MTLAGPSPNWGMWSEKAWVSISYYGTGSQTNNDIQLQALVDTFTIDGGDKDIDAKMTLIGGRLAKKTPQTEVTLAFDAFVVGTGGENAVAAPGAVATGINQYFDDKAANWSVGGNLANSLNREIWRIAILFTDDTAATSATASTASGTNNLRYIFVHAWLTKHTATFNDKELKHHFEFKVLPFNKFNIGNIITQAANTGLAALSAYNSTNYSITATAAYTV